MALPVITSISPPSGSAGGGDTITIIGSAMTGATSVAFGATNGTIISNTDTQIVVLSPAHGIGTVDITVTTAGGTSVTGVFDLYTFNSLGSNATQYPPLVRQFPFGRKRDLPLSWGPGRTHDYRQY